MSLNVAHHKDGITLFNGEWLLIYYDGCQLQFEPSGERTQLCMGTKKGRIYLTTHRIIFRNTNANDAFQSLSIPISNLRNVDVEQPILGANNIHGKVVGESGGGWVGEAAFRIWFNSGGAIDFGYALLEATRRTAQNRLANAQPSSDAAAGRLYAVAPPAYTPSLNEVATSYAFVPFSSFPGSPSVGSVYMWTSPPPYPGITGQYVPSPFDASAPDAPAPEPLANVHLRNSTSTSSPSHGNVQVPEATIVFGYFDPNSPNVVYTLEPTPNGVPYADTM